MLLSKEFLQEVVISSDLGAGRAGSGIVLFTSVFWVPNFWVPFQLLRTEKNPTGDRNQFVLRYTKNTKYPLSLNRSSVCLCACCCTYPQQWAVGVHLEVPYMW